jgi:hypothetical protein
LILNIIIDAKACAGIHWPINKELPLSIRLFPSRMLGLCLALPMLIAVLSATCGPSRADEPDAFGLEEKDPELPARIKAWNADCLSCHSEQGLAKPPRPGMDMVLLAKLLVDHPRFEASDHGKMACKDCHSEAYVPYPHLPNAKARIKGCEPCHQQPARTITPEFKASKHFKDHTDKFTCLSCHDSHTMRKAAKLPTAQAASRQDNHQCQACHEDDKRYATLVKPGTRRPEMAAVHAWLPEMALHLDHVRCVDCHSPMADLALSHEVQGKDKAVRRCEACHAEAGELGRRLYKPMLIDQPGEKEGFANAALLREVYVVGANRNRWIDLGGLGALALAALALLIRLVRRRKT